MIISFSPLFISLHSLLESFGFFYAWIIPNAFPSVPEESLVHALQRTILLPSWLFYTVLMILMVLIFG